MAEIRDWIIQLARGPYDVDEQTGPRVAQEVWFRHFRPAELWIAREFIRKAILPGRYYFDVYLLTEEAEDFIRKEPEALWRMAIPYMHRIDAVCYYDNKVALIEFKLRLKYSAIGQLAGYRDWFKRQYAPREEVELIAVYRFERPELWETCDRLGIRRIRLR